MWKKGTIGLILLLTSATLIVVIDQDPDGITTIPGCALIIVSDLNGFDGDELEKADQFYRYLLDEDYSDDDICFLTKDTRNGYDDDPTVPNIREAFSWLVNRSELSSQSVIYISDHVIWTDGGPVFRFSRGNITANMINNWLDPMEYQNLAMILNGNRSALAGPVLSGPSRDIICSMGSDQEFDPDLFNITRSLRNTCADMNGDEIVTYEEAFHREYEIITQYGQDPVIWI